jgi:hypothetical protein
MNASELTGRMVTVVEDYRAQYPDPIIMKTGDPLQLGEEDVDWVGWIWCTNAAGKGGWVPLDCISGSGETGTALCDYSAAELTARAGECLMVLEERSGWVRATNERGETGWIPIENIGTDRDESGREPKG